MAFRSFGIIGLGLIGGSLARALRFRLGSRHIVGIDNNQLAIDSAIADGVISSGSSDLSALKDCDIVFICTPLNMAFTYLDSLSSIVKPSCIVTDVSSTKSEIVHQANNSNFNFIFIGGHPMAGSEKVGYEAGSSHMFENAYYILCPSNSSTSESLIIIEDIVKQIGALPIKMDAPQHDMITGSISHVPHIVASALVNLVKNSDTEDSKMQRLAAGGFKDITRIASSNPAMWSNISFSNKHEVLKILANYIEILASFKNNLECDEKEAVNDFFNSSKLFRDSFQTSGKGLLPSVFEIVVDVEDKPGIIGYIATILGNHDINIKNMSISNSREFDEGCLRITLSDEESQSKAFELLKTSGYAVIKCC